MEAIDKRLVSIADNGDRLYPYKKKQRLTNYYGFALTAPGEQDRNGGGTYTEDLNLVVKKLIFDGWSVRVKTTDKVDLQRDGTLGIRKKVIVGYELAEELVHLVKGAQTKPSKIFKEKSYIAFKGQSEKNRKTEDETAIDQLPIGP